MQLQSSGANSAEAREVQNLLALRGCRGGVARNAARPAEPSGPFIFRFEPRDARTAPAPPRLERPPENRRARAAPPSKPVPETRSATFRTLCVRTCDGYYFPISFSTSRERLETDAETCQQMCPASDARLFYHAARRQGPEDMQSLDGTAYSALPNAFRYRSVLDQNCTCGKKNQSISLPSAAFLSEGARSDYAQLPEPRSAPGEDPETLLNRRGGLAARSGPPSLALTDDAAGRSIRVVWPAWNDELSEVMISSVPN